MARLVLEKRAYPRVSLAGSGLLVHRDGMYRARLENISLAGALVALEPGGGPHIERGERCSFALYRGGAVAGALRFTVRMAHFGFDMACIRFVNLDQNTRLMLRSLIAHQVPGSHPAPAGGALERGSTR